MPPPTLYSLIMFVVLGNPEPETKVPPIIIEKKNEYEKEEWNKGEEKKVIKNIKTD